MTPESLNELSTYPHFPASATDLIRIIGLEAAARLITAWPGQEFPVPQCTRNTPCAQTRFDQLSAIVGSTAARLITKNWGGQKLNIPNCRLVLWVREQKRIRADYDRLTGPGGHSHPEAVFAIGIAVGVSGRCIEMVLKRSDVPPTASPSAS